ncbi:DoxX family protein [Millisia brevis]|uniref:DoxX family protein n=1 Tax=Millisia brevis TaxID=264148 RepID=UPI000836F1AE|nr:DoxX family protein [Millisia brevis]
MTIVTWIATGLLALVFLTSGAMKLIRTSEQLAESGLKWTEDVAPGTVKLIGGAEVLGALGVVVGGLVAALQWAAVAAAGGLGLVMIGAIAVHARRKETSMIIVNVALLAVAILAAVGWAIAGR